MAEQSELGAELEALFARFVEQGTDPLEVAKEVEEQLNVFIGRHNLEFELSSTPSSAIAPGS